MECVDFIKIEPHIFHACRHYETVQNEKLLELFQNDCFDEKRVAKHYEHVISSWKQKKKYNNTKQLNQRPSKIISNKEKKIRLLTSYINILNKSNFQQISKYINKIKSLEDDEELAQTMLQLSFSQKPYIDIIIKIIQENFDDNICTSLFNNFYETLKQDLSRDLNHILQIDLEDYNIFCDFQKMKTTHKCKQNIIILATDNIIDYYMHIIMYFNKDCDVLNDTIIEFVCNLCNNPNILQKNRDYITNDLPFRIPTKISLKSKYALERIF